MGQVLDLGLRAGDGFIVLENFRKDAHLCLIPVIVVSGRDVQGNRDHAMEAGARAYLQKPWNDSELLALMAQLLGQPEPSVS